MEIKVGIGIENIVFGMSEEEVKNILGDPDKINEYKDINIINYYYNLKMINLEFDKDEGNRLCSIEVNNPKMTIFGNNAFYKTKEEIEMYLRDNGYFDFEYEDYDTFETLFCEEIWITFKIELNRVRSIEFGPLFNDSDDIIWPSSYKALIN